MQKTMQKPVNWQDFEQLCKKLWGEIWDCPSIKKNGRSGQAQHGVDIYGIPKGEQEYFGIQCKGKDDYTKSNLEEDEIDEEIEKAKTFKPELKILIFATSGNKDAKIEEYVRTKNIENIKAGLFQVDIFSWEDIVDLIDVNKKTYDWYLRNITRGSNYKIEFRINGEISNLVINPLFVKNIEIIRKPVLIPSNSALDSIIRMQESLLRSIPTAIAIPVPTNFREINHSMVELIIELINSGDTAIEYYKYILEIENDAIEFYETNISDVGILNPIRIRNYNYVIDKNMLTYTHHPERHILVPGDKKQINIFAKLPSDECEFQIKYKFLSKDYSTCGAISCSSIPIFEEVVKHRVQKEGEAEGRIVRIEEKIDRQ